MLVSRDSPLQGVRLQLKIRREAFVLSLTYGHAHHVRRILATQVEIDGQIYRRPMTVDLEVTQLIQFGGTQLEEGI